MDYKNDPVSIYGQYLSGIEYLRKGNYFSECEDNYKFYIGKQWEKEYSGKENTPVYNIIKNIVDYKVAAIAQKGFSIVYQPTSLVGDYERKSKICEVLNTNASRNWEKLRMDKNIWDIILDGAVFGSSYAYFYMTHTGLKMDIIDSANILFGDEQLKDIQKQPYIIISQRFGVDELKNMAESYGVDESEILKIMPDEETETFLGDKAKYEVENTSEGGKCICLLKLYRKNGEIHAVRVTKNAVIMPESRLTGLKDYPVCRFAWKEDKGSCRGLSEVAPIRENQVEINKALFRLLSGIKQYAFPHVVYDSAVLGRDGVEKLSTVGSSIALNNMKMQKIEDVIGYMQPTPINPIASGIIPQMISLTTELAGTSEASLGTVNPENASGAAIIAVRDAAEIPLNRHVASLRQFVEDMAEVWAQMLFAYSDDEFTVILTGDDKMPYAESILREDFSKYTFDIRIDISSSSPYSKYAREDALQKLFLGGAITFEEYVESLDDDSASPKGKLKDIISSRRKAGDVPVG